MRLNDRHALCTALLLASALGTISTQAAADNAAPTAKQICEEARANILRARMTYADKPLHDVAHITKIFNPRQYNEYQVELRDANERDKRYPDIWMEGYYSMADEKLLGSPLMAHSVGDKIMLHATVAQIDFIEHPADAPVQRPACRLGVRIDWDKAAKP